MSFSKLDSGITKSSLWSEDLHVRIVFVSFLAEKDENGFVSGSRSGLIRLCNVTPEQFDNAIMKLSSPDQDSKSKDFEGRRIDIVEGGWIVLNSDKYRAPEQDKKQKRNEYMKEYMRNKRNLIPVNSNIKLTPVNGVLTSVSVSVSDSVSDSVLSSNKQTSINTSSPGGADWRTNFQEYLKIVEDAKQKILDDTDIIEKRILHFWKNINVEKSLELSITNFWGTEAGWKNKKKCKGKTIDMVETLLKNIDKNKVFKNAKDDEEEFIPAWSVPL
jgi:hypothetical protein